MGHRPYPDADRSRRYVDSRHGTSCPRCGHPASVHPYRRGQFQCGQSRDGLPTCRECAARIMHLRNGPLPALADAAAGFQALVPSVNVAPGRAVVPGQVSVQVQDNAMSVAEAVRRNLISIDRVSSRRRV